MTKQTSWRNHRVLVFKGSRDTNKNDILERDYETRTLGEIFGMEPGSDVKNESLAMIPSAYARFDGRAHSVQREKGQFVALTADIDKGNHSYWDIEGAALSLFGRTIDCRIYSSSSATSEDKRWRIIAPLAEPMKFDDWNLWQRTLYAHLEERLGTPVDWSLARAAQPVYLPNVPPAGRHPDGKPIYHINQVLLGEPITPDNAAALPAIELVRQADAAEAQKAELARQEAFERLKNRQSDLGYRGSPIEAYNAAHGIEDLLPANGYVEGKRNQWRSPYQTGKTFATRVFGDYWVSLSESDVSAGLGRACTSGRFGDAFDIYCHFEHGGDVSKAVKQAAIDLGLKQAKETRRELQQRENVDIQEEEPAEVESVLSLEAMLNSLVFVADGSYVTLLDRPRQGWSLADARNLFKPSYTTIEAPGGRVKEISTIGLWLKDAARLQVDKRTFAPGRSRFCTDPEGATAINTWSPISRKAVDAEFQTYAVQVFLNQVAFLFPEEIERNVFLDWLAHIEQRPGELPHYGWLHISSRTGTGRNWLASVLARVWRGMVAPNVDLPALLDSAYNGPLSGRVLALVDEVREGGNSDVYKHAQKIKSLVNAETRQINPKYGRMSLEYNSCRWMVFSNHNNALQLDDQDRRWRVAMLEVDPRPPEDYEEMYQALADPRFTDAIGLFLKHRDIRHFKPGERPPLNKAKQMVLSASRSETRIAADELLELWGSDVITNQSAASWLSQGNDNALSRQMRRVLEEVGAVQLLDKKANPKMFHPNGKSAKAWALRDAAIWQSADKRVVETEIERGERSSTNHEFANAVGWRYGT